jgi:hypothetical protein
MGNHWITVDGYAEGPGASILLSASFLCRKQAFLMQSAKIETLFTLQK